MKKQLCIILALCTVGVAQENPFELYSLSRQWLEQGDTAAYMKYAKAARDAAPFDLWFSANLARAYAMNKQKIRCIEILDDLSVLGFDFDILNDEGFKNIWTHSLLKEITKRARRNNPREKSITAFTVQDSVLTANGIAYDPRRNIFYLGNLHHRTIVALRSDGSASAVSAGSDTIPNPFSLKIDAARNRFWVAGDATLRLFDLETMSPMNTAAANDSLEHFFHDLVILRNGDLFITDSKTGTIYSVNGASGVIEPWLESGDLTQPKGIAVSSDDMYLFVAHWKGISRISMEDKRVTLLPAKVKTTMTGIDGLYFRNGSLIAVQNNAGPQSRIMQFELSKKMDAVTKATVLESGHHLHDTPTRGVIVGDDLYYIANSRKRSADGDGNIRTAGELKPTHILKLPLDK